MPTAFFLRLCALVVCLTSAASGLFAQEDTEKDAALQARLKQYLPHTLPKLQRRARIRVTVVGDSIGNFYLPVGEESLNIRNAWHWKFLSKLGSRFYYSGDIRNGTAKAPPAPALATLEEMTAALGPDPSPDLNLPPRGSIEQLIAGLPGAPEIVLENFCRGGASSIHADQVLTTNGFDDHPDLVLWMYGVNDANAGNPVEAYREALAATIRHCREHNADLIIAGPSLIYGQDIQTLSKTLPYSREARQLAEKNGLLFLDMAAALGTVTLPDAVEPATAFPAFLKELLVRYEHQGTADGLHPNARGHEIMAEAAWKTLSEGMPPDLYQPRGSFTLPSEGNPPVLEIMLRQPPTGIDPPPEMTDLMLTALSPPGGWQRAGEPTFLVKPFVDHKLTRMPLEPLAGAETSLPLGINTTCGFILYHEKTARLFEIGALVLPISLDIPASRIEGVAGDLLVDCVVSNRQDHELRAPVKVDWLGKKITMDLAVEAHSEKPLRLRLPLPSGENAHEKLTVRLNNDGKEYVFQRMVDATRNLVPNQKISLTSSGGPKPDPTLLIKADQYGLYCTVELLPARTTPGAEPSPDVVILTLDARGPTERGKTGYVDPIRFELPAQDGPIVLKRLRPAVFGSGYDREINPATIRASLKTERNGQRLVQIDIPRNDFYLHNWSLADKGQNTLGFNLEVYVATTVTDVIRSWAWANSHFGDDDASSLGVLQLSPKATGEWSVRIY